MFDSLNGRVEPKDLHRQTWRRRSNAAAEADELGWPSIFAGRNSEARQFVKSH